jgi:hypothetical protein
LAAQRSYARQASRDQIERIFATELGRLPAKARHRRAAAIDAAISGESWDLFRSTYELSPAQATATLVEAVTALLGP